MGYKLVGCDVLGCVEIDKKMNEIYVKNHQPRYNYLMDIREFNQIPDTELPQELFNLDILDGSPPCTTFSMSRAGIREKTWGKKKKFNEGQTSQVLDELVFTYLDTCKKLYPKVIIMENVKGIIMGNAIEQYHQKILKKFNDIGYDVNFYILKGEQMGVPQTRHRIFYVGIRKDLKFDFTKLNLDFNYKPILFKEVKSGKGVDISHTQFYQRLLLADEKYHRTIGDISKQYFNSNSGFTLSIVWEDKVSPTVTTKGLYRGNDRTLLSKHDYINIQTFPQDFDFMTDSIYKINYIIGMSVPPVMIKRLVNRLINTNIFK